MIRLPRSIFGAWSVPSRSSTSLMSQGPRRASRARPGPSSCSASSAAGSSAPRRLGVVLGRGFVGLGRLLGLVGLVLALRRRKITRSHPGRSSMLLTAATKCSVFRRWTRARHCRATDAGSSATGTKLAVLTGWMTSWAIRSPRVKRTACSRSVLTRQTLISPAVAGVDRARRVHDGDPVPGGQSGARMHEGRVSLGQRDGHAGADQPPLPRREQEVLGAAQVGPGVTGMRVRRGLQPGVELEQQHLDRRRGRAMNSPGQPRLLSVCGAGRGGRRPRSVTPWRRERRPGRGPRPAPPDGGWRPASTAPGPPGRPG